MPALILMFIIKGLSDMQKSITFTMAVAAICLAISCQSKLQSEIPENSTRTITVHATQAESRTAIAGTTAEGKVSYTWELGDRLKLFELTEGDEPLSAVSDPLNSAQSNVQFSVTFNENPQGDDLKYVGVYLPGVNDEYGFAAASRYYWYEQWGPEPSEHPWSIRLELPFDQVPSETSFDSKADLLVSRMVEQDSSRPGEIDLAFARVGSVAKITLTGLPPGDEVLRVNFSHGESWVSSGKVWYFPESEKIKVIPHTVKSGDAATVRYIEAEPRNLVVDESGKAVIWLRVLSGTISDYFSIQVETRNGKDYSYFEKNVDLTSFTPARSITFEEGDITAFSVAMERSPLIRFTEETLELFPELNSTNPMIRIPRDYYMFRDPELKLGIECYGESWSAELDGMDEGEWLGLFQYSSQDDCVYLEKNDAYWFTNDVHRATLKIYCDNELELEIPIEEDGNYYANQGLPLSLTLRMGNQVISNNGHVNLKSGVPVTFTVSLSNIPSWLEGEYWESVWGLENQGWPDGIFYPSPNLPISDPGSLYDDGSLSNTGYTSEITITPGEYGDDILYFEHYIYLSKPTLWLQYVGTGVQCYVTVGSGVFLDDRFSGESGSAGNPQNPGDFNGGTHDL